MEITPLMVITAVAKAYAIEPAQIWTRAGEHDAARDMAIWLATRLIKPAWSPHEIGIAFNRDAKFIVAAQRRAGARYANDKQWRSRALSLRDALRPKKPRMQVLSETSVHAPPIAGDEVNWGFTSHAGGRHYLADQNTAFCEAMRKAIEAGYERLPAPVEG